MESEFASFQYFKHLSKLNWSQVVHIALFKVNSFLVLSELFVSSLHLGCSLLLW